MLNRRKPGTDRTDTKFPAHFAGNWLSVPGFAPQGQFRGVRIDLPIGDVARLIADPNVTSVFFFLRDG